MMRQPAGRIAQAWQRVADQESARIRDAFLKSPEAPAGLRPVLASALAVAVLLSTVAVAGLGVWLALRGLGLLGPLNGAERMISGFFGLLLLCIVWLARPRFQVTPGVVVGVQDAPEFHALVAEVAQQLGVAVPVRVTLLPEVNAFMARSGFPPRPALGYGLPLWYALHPQERVAVLAHELAHERNNDPTRGRLIGLALNVLAQIEFVSRPDRLFGGGLFDLLSNLMQWVVSWIPLALYHTLLKLVGADQQRAEYRADLLAADIAGTAATVSALDKLHLTGSFESALHKQRHFPERPHAFLELRHVWDTMPDDQRQRRRDAYRQFRVRLDNSHPPTIDRTQVVQAYPHAPRVVLTPERAAQIDAELTPFVAPLEREAHEAYREANGW